MSIHLVSIHQQMSSCLTGAAGRAYALDLEMMIVKSPSSTSSSTITSHSPTLSESGGNCGNSPFTISTRKPRTPRKRPNQTYNEAAALLSTAYPGIFSAKPCKFTKPIDTLFSGNSNSGRSVSVSGSGSGSGSGSDLLLLHHHRHRHQTPVLEKPRLLLPVEPIRLTVCDKMLDGIDEDLETESMFDGEIEEGIDSIMGNSDSSSSYGYTDNNNNNNWCYGYPMGWGIDRETSSSSFEWILGQRNGVRALRHADDGDWWRYPRVDVTEISPKLSKIPSEKKKKKTVTPAGVPPPPPAEEKPNLTMKLSNKHGLLLKLNHDNLLAEWSDRGSPFSDEQQPTPGNEELYDRLAQIDLFSENNGVREASVLRYKEKRRSRLFFKKIRYQVRKVNADQRPRLKGRFVRRPGSPFLDEETT